MRLVDADALIKDYEMSSNRHDKSKLCGVSYEDFFDAVIYDVSHAPTVDAVEVVRCKNCKFFEDEDGDGDCWCYCHNDITCRDGFCSWGERKDESK